MTDETGPKVESGPSDLDEVLKRVQGQMPAEVHAVRSKMIGAYTAFVAATLIASITNSVAIGGGKLVICLFSISLPALVGHLLLDRTVTVIQQRKTSAYRGAALGLGIVPSLMAFAILIGHVSIVGAVLFVVGCVYWLLVVDVVTAAGARDKNSTI
ncbi:hypothetical protein [Burkholderia contaminans]|uniref:Uncharacterized protein n=1 Tax=Burkholderia contaminans TaxID=488447 RepID=A0A6P3BU65_9BURK|nr:hypothetical protein [Burkholderia contaminans]VWD62354.1 hypothetical protein BCO71033_06747 [Burkholderia contaminans]